MPTLLELRTRIKNEARVKSSADLDAWIDSTINGVVKNHTYGEKRYQLIVRNAAITISTDGQSQFTLPVGFAKIIDVTFSPYPAPNDVWYPLEERNQFRFPYTQGNPKWYELMGGNLVITPYSLLRTNQQLRMTYQKTPTAMTADAHVLEIPELEQVIVDEVVGRVLRYHKSQDSELYLQDARRANANSLNG